MSDVIVLNKPFNVLSQFTDETGRDTLGQYIEQQGFYPAGRLDRDSEGLLLLTNDGRIQHLISHPRHKMDKTYWAQVEGEIDTQACQRLLSGVELKDGLAVALQAERIATPDIWSREPAVRFRQSIPTSWLKLVINEGRNRQVRRMTAAVGYPTLRLIRVAIGPWQLGELKPGEWELLAVDSSLQELARDPKWTERKRPARHSRHSVKKP